MRARARQSALGKNLGRFRAEDLTGITGQILRSRAAVRLALLSYPLSPTAFRGGRQRPVQGQAGTPDGLKTAGLRQELRRLALQARTPILAVRLSAGLQPAGASGPPRALP